MWPQVVKLLVITREQKESPEIASKCKNGMYPMSSSTYSQIWSQKTSDFPSDHQKHDGMVRIDINIYLLYTIVYTITWHHKRWQILTSQQLHMVACFPQDLTGIQKTSHSHKKTYATWDHCGHASNRIKNIYTQYIYDIFCIYIYTYMHRFIYIFYFWARVACRRPAMV